MNSLEQMMGLNPQGYPQDMGYTDDPMLQYGMMDDQDAMMAQMGMAPMEDPYAMVGMDAPQGMTQGAELARQMLGGPAPQVGQEELNALAQALGLNNRQGITVDPMQDPMYSPRFDTMAYLGGFNG